MAEELMVEPIVEVAEQVGRTFGLGSVISISLGVGIIAGTSGYFYGKRKGYADAVKKFEKEIDDLREYFQAEKKAREESGKPSPAEIVEEKGYVETDGEVEVVDEGKVEGPVSGPTPYDRMSRPEDMEPVNVFDEMDHSWDYAAEVKQRRQFPDDPYVIHRAEFVDNEPDHEQLSYTYFEADDILADIDDTIVADIDAVVGLSNLERFGHGSHNPNVVYIRNDGLDIDIELTRDGGSFHETMHGEIKHSAQRKSNRAKDKRKRRDRRFDDE